MSNISLPFGVWAHPRVCDRGLQAAMGQCEIIGKGKHIHIVGPCRCLLGSYAAGQNCMGQHEGVESQPTIRSMGPFESLHMEAYQLLRANSRSLARGKSSTWWANAARHLPHLMYKMWAHTNICTSYTASAYTNIYTCGPMSGFSIHTTIIYVFVLRLLQQSMRHGLGRLELQLLAVALLFALKW